MTYLDNNATTRPDPQVVDAIVPLLAEHWGNASSAHRFGAQVAAEVEAARGHVARLIGARDSEIVFTSGGTEADNAALRGVLAATPEKRHLIISAIEHHAILETAEQLEREGVAVTQIGVDTQGRLDLDALAGAFCEDTALVSIMLANNETGVVLPLREVCDLAAAHNVPVHTDAVNALGKIPVDVAALGVSLLSLSGHKIYGPKGVGALCIRRGTPFQAWQIGGGQERRRRGGTLNTPGIIGLGKACELLAQHADDDNARIGALRERLEAALRAQFPQVQIIGAESARLPNTTCACFAGLPSEPIVMLLSEAGVCVSSGSACTSGSLELSHVLKAMQIDAQVGQGEVRFSLGRFNTDADIDRLLEHLPRVIEKVAASAPAL
jgi:cysteine desulfurase